MVVAHRYRDWHQLPEELLVEISKRLDFHFETLCFRSVCQSWRFSSPLRTTPSFNPTVPLPKYSHFGEKNRAGDCKVVERTIYAIQPKTDQPPHFSKVWIIKVEEETGKPICLWDPLSERILQADKDIGEYCPEGLNLLDFKINCLCKQYVLTEPGDFLYRSQKMLSSTSTPTNEDFLLMRRHCWRYFGFLCAGDESWSNATVENPSDIVHYKGQFYVVDSSGRTFVVDPRTLDSTQVVEPLIDGHDETTRLVESNGELFLVDIFQYADGPPLAYPILWKVFILNEEKREWVQVHSLGGRMFVVTEGFSFSIPASYLPVGCKGNCILFTEHSFMFEEWIPDFEDNYYDYEQYGSNILLNLENGECEQLQRKSSYLSLFWPPPTWISTPNSQEDESRKH